MATIAENTAAKAPKTAKERLDRTVRQGKVATARAVRAVKSAGTKAKSHISRNRAAYIAGGLATTAGAAGGAALASRNRKPED